MAPSMTSIVVPMVTTDTAPESADTAPHDNTSTIALVTGANKGLGRETVRRIAALGWTVYLGARDPERGKAATAELATDGADVRHLLLDVTSDESVAEAVQVVTAESGRLDVLVNNAGITGGRTAVEATVAGDFLAPYGVNVLGPVRVTHAFLPLLHASRAARIVMVSSGVGSHGVTSDVDRLESRIQSLVYPSSKAALNMVTAQYAKALPGMRVNAVDPGYTATDLNDHQGHQDIEEGTDAIVAMATIDADGPTGGFYDRSGPIPW
jgi:NAD(P)-dependent dehydrogenase (short-subunit alcohol dehydrogenase family)